MRYLVLAYIERLKGGTVIRLSDLYSGIYRALPDACEKLGYTAQTPVEEKWKNQIRWGLRDAKDRKLVVNLARGLYKRI